MRSRVNVERRTQTPKLELDVHPRLNLQLEAQLTPCNQSLTELRLIVICELDLIPASLVVRIAGFILVLNVQVGMMCNLAGTLVSLSIQTITARFSDWKVRTCPPIGGLITIPVSSLYKE